MPHTHLSYDIVYAEPQRRSLLGKLWKYISLILSL